MTSATTKATNVLGLIVLLAIGMPLAYSLHREKYDIALPDGTRAIMKGGNWSDIWDGSTVILSINSGVTIATRKKDETLWANEYFEEPSSHDRIDSFVIDGAWYYTAYVTLL